MITITINGRPVHAREGATVLEASREDKYASRQFDINVLSLNYLKDVQAQDFSGLCIAEISGKGIVNASTVAVEEGMEITTNPPEVVAMQQKALREILDHHDLDCRNCLRTGNCELQELQHALRTTKKASDAKRKLEPVTEDGILIRDHNKCVRCGRCVAVCGHVQGIGAIRMEGEGMEGRVVPSKGASLAESGCVNCGQCISVCPVGALRERDDVDRILALLADPEKYVVIQVAPSVRASIGEMFGYPVGSETKGKLVAALRALGFDRVFDTVFGADLTIMEEASELISRLEHGGKLPMFTSCCPGWVSYCENNHKELLEHISTCKSPQQMFGAMVKTYLSEKEGIAKDRIVVVSAMPCTAKKYELTRPGQDAAGVFDVDYSITNRELGRMIEGADISFLALEDQEFDVPFGIGTGAGTIFGATGGVMEAALRTANDWMNGTSQEAIDFRELRGVAGVKEADYKVGNRTLKVAAVSGLNNTEMLLEKIQSGQASYDFVEVMACPGGCVNGGGQPQQLSEKRTVIDIRENRANTLYHLDERNSVRKSYENSAIKELYSSYLKQPGSDKAHAYLHTTYQAKGE